MVDEQVKDLFGSDSDDEAPQAEKARAGGDEAQAERQAGKAAATNLFGSSDEDDEPPGASHPVTQALGEDEDEYPARSPSPGAARGPPVYVDLETFDVQPQDSLRLVKLPNILGVEARPFDPDTFDAGAEEEVDERGFKRVRLRDQNCIRWRWGVDEEGNQVRESNARFVRWSDGSLQLVVGDEVMDVKEIDTTNEHTYMCVRLPGLIQGQGQLTRKMVFQPASLQSNLHKQLRAAADKLHVKTQRVRATTTLVDPKKLKAEQERAEAERIRSREKLAERQTKTMRKFGLPAMPRARMPQQLNADYLEEDEDQDEEEGMGEDLQEAQRQRMLGRARGAYDEDEEEAAARLAAAKSGAPAPGGKRRRIEEEEEEEEELSAEEEEDEEEMKDFIVDEEEEEEGGRAGGTAAAEEEEAPPPSKQQQQPAVKQRRQVVLSDSEDE
ncbi:hypothetical protein CHLNCDRAFT_137949 [Chlorella variabilis]|uniref:Leo1-like protein n=1 Tax=Chlorella variabilis TaxID=554065 RepID=E1Z4X2_CHLVA|nr:hypothetical protein CHLNCDRAFT_137949 [Chlorella variabilis]EFN59422.1 hypothetical protein CHLNCDRAFT_137949 [Chlorella variabilis]|eukprot:XP_005851524.1 hypothetical protein CHLNCDRAFT_137949 [Chlorella variabilis]